MVASSDGVKTSTLGSDATVDDIGTVADIVGLRVGLAVSLRVGLGVTGLGFDSAIPEEVSNPYATIISGGWCPSFELYLTIWGLRERILIVTAPSFPLRLLTAADTSIVYHWSFLTEPILPRRVSQSGALFHVTLRSDHGLVSGAMWKIPPCCASVREYIFRKASTGVDALSPDAGMSNLMIVSWAFGPVERPLTFKKGSWPWFESGEPFMIVASSDAITDTTVA
mmetsp:Transcript_38513/g.71011  ORF Transcript_38513/g.71011 Transcript_38513/m.71011 type:complete len:225 (+) Transcript_38513:768-1442(+)